MRKVAVDDANGVMFINGQAPNVQNVAVPKWLVSMQWQYTGDLPQRLEEWKNAVGNGGLYGSTIDANFGGDMNAQFPTTLVGVNDGDTMGANDIVTIPNPQTGTATTQSPWSTRAVSTTRRATWKAPGGCRMATP